MSEEQTKTEEPVRARSAFFDQLVHVGDPLLRREAKRVTDFAQAKECADLLTRAVREIVGAGLAANQLGIDLQVAVIEVRKTEMFPHRPESGLFVLVNPDIVSYGSEVEDDWEGCFSVPHYIGRVTRPNAVRVNMQTVDGEDISIDFEGYVARVAQHEIDHLKGTVYIDRMESMKDFFTRENYRKYVLKTEG
jgi:peptide deformylase